MRFACFSREGQRGSAKLVLKLDVSIHGYQALAEGDLRLSGLWSLYLKKEEA